MNEKFQQILQKYERTFKECSADTSNNVYMSDSLTKASDFDGIKDAYVEGMSVCEKPASCDAVWLNSNETYLVEFKSGKVEKYLIGRKVYDSLLMLLDLTGQTIGFSRRYWVFVLVYNKEKEWSSLKKIQNRTAQNAGDHFVGFGLERFEKIYFKEVKTMSKDEFDSFVSKAAIA
ncbi:MAG: hypothetical protein FWH32_00240 [Clostridiales bacterium]|nr:hypothetical protein [Clostridiales bacterium]